MTFSIIICTYNSEKKLPRTLDSILAQTFSDYEVVIVDGASTDGTVEIIKQYEPKFAGRLRWISEKDNGIYEAMNKGIDLAQGEWLYFLGSDDIFLEKDVLKKVAEKIKEKEINCQLEVVYGDVLWGETKERYAGKFSVLKLMRQNICHQAMFFRKKLFLRLGKFETQYTKLADYVFNMKWFNDDSVGRQYLDMVIARFSLGGASSFPDEKFIQDRDSLIEKYFPKEYVQLNEGEKKERNVDKLLQRIKELEEEIELMKSSKFWKMREVYLRMKKF